MVTGATEFGKVSVQGAEMPPTDYTGMCNSNVGTIVRSGQNTFHLGALKIYELLYNLHF